MKANIKKTSLKKKISLFIKLFFSNKDKCNNFQKQENINFGLN